MVVLAETQIIVEMRPAIAVERKIGRHHIAFFRAILQGMGINEIISKPGWICAAQKQRRFEFRFPCVRRHCGAATIVMLIF
jgi:hypothetical protein